MIINLQEPISSNGRGNLTVKHFVDAEMNLEAIGSKRFKGFGVEIAQLLEVPWNP